MLNHAKKIPFVKIKRKNLKKGFTPTQEDYTVKNVLCRYSFMQ